MLVVKVVVNIFLKITGKWQFGSLNEFLPLTTTFTTTTLLTTTTYKKMNKQQLYRISLLLNDKADFRIELKNFN